ncbi:Sterol O-acyltransferase 2 (Sterol-ester synthase 2), partial [Elasticomyces elasticus]
MTDPPASRRPHLPSNDTLDAPQLAGTLSSDGIAALEAKTRLTQPPVLAAATRSQSVGSSVPSSVEGDWTPSHAASSDEENYDASKPEPEVILGAELGIDGQVDITTDDAGPVGHSGRNEGEENTQRNDGVGSTSPDAKPLPPERKKSIQIRLEKTDKRGHYILTADEPEIREILRQGVEKEKADQVKKKRSFRDLVFTRQFTTFDRQNPLSSESPFHGFFTLFWLTMVLIFLRVSLQNWRDYGSIFGNNEIMKIMFGRDVLVLGVFDAAMCAGTAFGLIFQKAVFRGYVNWSSVGWIVQNVWQTFYLAAIVWWIWYREWPWPHTIFTVLHALVFLMKQHSYSFYNGHLSGVYKRRELLRRKLQQLEDTDAITSAPSSPMDSKSIPASAVDLAEPDTLQLRRRSVGMRTSTHLENEKSEIASVAVAIESGESLNADQVQAFERVIKAEVDSLTKELNGKCQSGSNAYPKNLTLANFIEWTLFPTLVYELEYPRQERINWYYVAEKTGATFGVIG